MKGISAIVLGGTLPHCDLVLNLKDRGYRVVLVDYNDNPPAKRFSDSHIKESTLDLEKVCEIAIQENAALVISTCVDQANLIACLVGEKLGLPIPYSSELAKVVTDKVAMKSLMLKQGISTSAFVEFECIQELRDINLKWPLIVKPVDSNSSKGVRRVENRSELNQFASEALSLSRSGMAIVEEFVEGVEIGIDCIVYNGVAQVLMVKERRKIHAIEEQQIYGCIWPKELDAIKQSKYQSIAQKITNALGLKSSPLMIQAIESANDIAVIEFAARIGGGESFRLIQKSVGVNVIDLAIDTFLGKRLNVKIQEPIQFYAENFIYAKPCKFGMLAGYTDLLENGIIEYIDSNKEPGTVIGSALTSNNRVGVFAVRGANRDVVMKKVAQALKQLEVIDDEGRNQLRKDIYSESQF